MAREKLHLTENQPLLLMENQDNMVQMMIHIMHILKVSIFCIPSMRQDMQMSIWMLPKEVDYFISKWNANYRHNPEIYANWYYNPEYQKKC